MHSKLILTALYCGGLNAQLAQIDRSVPLIGCPTDQRQLEAASEGGINENDPQVTAASNVTAVESFVNSTAESRDAESSCFEKISDLFFRQQSHHILFFTYAIRQTVAVH
jgi:hypothetical protein